MKTKLVAGMVLFTAMTTFAQKPQPNMIMIAVDDQNDWIGAFDGHQPTIMEIIR